MRVLTFNVLADRADWRSRSSVVRSGLQDLDADLLALQETVVRPGRDQVAELLGDGHHVVHSQLREDDGIGMSLVSRWPVLRSWQRPLPTSSRVPVEEFSHQLMAVLVEAPALGRVFFASPKPTFRFGHEVEREVMSVAAVGAIEQIARDCGAEHVVCAGDFDAVPESSSMRYWRGCSRCRTRAWRTSTSWSSCMVPPPLVCRRSTLTAGIWPSDHFGVLAVLSRPAG